MDFTFKQMSIIEKALRLAKKKIADEIKETINEKEGIVVSVFSHYDELTVSIIPMCKQYEDREYDIKVTAEGITVNGQCTDEEAFAHAKYIQSVLKDKELEVY